MTNNPRLIVADRIKRTLTRLGSNDSVLQDIHDRQVTLCCPEADRNDHRMIQVAVRLIPGIKSAVYARNSDREDKS